MKNIMIIGAAGGVGVLGVLGIVAIMGSSAATAEATSTQITTTTINQVAPVLPTEMPQPGPHDAAMTYQGGITAASQMADATLTAEVGQATATALLFAARSGNPSAIAQIQRIGQAVAERNRNTAGTVANLEPAVDANTKGRENHDTIELARDKNLPDAYRTALLAAITTSPQTALPVLQASNKAAENATDARFVAVEKTAKSAIASAKKAYNRHVMTKNDAKSIATKVINDRFGSPLVGTGGFYRDPNTGVLVQDYKSEAKYNPDCISGGPGNCSTNAQSIAPAQSITPAQSAVSATNSGFIPARRAK